MTDPLQTGLATGSETISHTWFDPVYIRLCTDISLKLDFAFRSQPLVHSCLLCGPSLLFHLHFKGPKGGPLPPKLSDWAIPVNAHSGSEHVLRHSSDRTFS